MKIAEYFSLDIKQQSIYQSINQSYTEFTETSKFCLFAPIVILHVFTYFHILNFKELNKEYSLIMNTFRF